MATLLKDVLAFPRPYEAKISKCLLERKTFFHNFCLRMKHTFHFSALFMIL